MLETLRQAIEDALKALPENQDGRRQLVKVAGSSYYPTLEYKNKGTVYLESGSKTVDQVTRDRTATVVHEVNCLLAVDAKAWPVESGRGRTADNLDAVIGAVLEARNKVPALDRAASVAVEYTADAKVFVVSMTFTRLEQRSGQDD